MILGTGNTMIGKKSKVKSVKGAVVRLSKEALLRLPYKDRRHILKGAMYSQNPITIKVIEFLEKDKLEMGMATISTIAGEIDEPISKVRNALFWLQKYDFVRGLKVSKSVIWQPTYKFEQERAVKGDKG